MWSSVGRHYNNNQTACDHLLMSRCLLGISE